jgi:hypothetical protein
MLPPTAFAATASAAAASATAASGNASGGSSSAGAAALPLVLRPSEASRRRVASAAAANDLSSLLYATPLPLGAPAAARVRAPERGCRSRGYELHWNRALYTLPGTPATRGGGCARVVSVTATSVQRCCALCAAAGGTRRRPACSAWTFLAPHCVWSPRCRRTLADREIVWGAVSGMVWGTGQPDG